MRRSRPMDRRYALILTVIAVSCVRKAESHEPQAQLATEAGMQRLRQMRLDPDMRGISGVARTASGARWLVPERDRRLWFSQGSRSTARPIVGAPDAIDLESVAVVRPAGDGRPTLLAFGTESNAGRETDQVLFGEVLDDRVAIGDRIASWTFAYAPWRMKPRRNRGLEALCVAGEYLLAVTDNVFEMGGQRFAPVALRSIASVRDGTGGPSKWIRRSLRLKSKKGQISGVTCRLGSNGIHAVAIERHFGVMYLIRFDIDPSVQLADPRVQTLTATLAADISAAYPTGAPPNFEGLATMDATKADVGSGLVLFSDNDYGGVTGPTVSLTFSPLGSQP